MNHDVISVIWRGKQIKVEMNSDSNVKEFGLKLLELTKVKAETMKLLIPSSSKKGSNLLAPFSTEHLGLSLQEAEISSGKPIRMMGVFEDEVEEVSHNNLKPDLRIIGFDEEEKRMKQRLSIGPSTSLKLPQGAYIFCDFRTLDIPGIELNPPPSEALRRMHMLACDPGIIAIMNKHRWRVGIMTEMAPVGYVGISPKCILGFNKNHGEEISLRLRTDDLKGFRKYESIKKTLLHELAHMVYSEHDADFFALNRQLNEEAESLDWTKSRSHTLSGKKKFNLNDDEFQVDAIDHPTGQKVGGAIISTSARAASVAAAYSRILSSTDNQNKVEMNIEKSGDTWMETAVVESNLDGHGVTLVDDVAEPDPDDAISMHKHEMQIDYMKPFSVRMTEPDPDDSLDAGHMQYEPDPDDSLLHNVYINPGDKFEPDPDDSACIGNTGKTNQSIGGESCDKHGARIFSGITGLMEPVSLDMEPDPDDSIKLQERIKQPAIMPDQGGSMEQSELHQEPPRPGMIVAEPDPDDSMEVSANLELQRIEEPAAVICKRIQKAVDILRSEAKGSTESISSLQTLFKIIRNIIEHPDDTKFRRIRKANPSFQKNVANYTAALEILAIVGFSEDIVTDELGRPEAYMVLKRNDPGLLWLAKSSLEVSIA